MDLQKAHWAVRKLARENHTTEQRIIADIDQAIAEALETAQALGDEKVLSRWTCIPREGTVPSALELIAYLTDLTNRIQ